jgi:uncharacterized membrane protein YhaH (DUF805 family)
MQTKKSMRAKKAKMVLPAQKGTRINIVEDTHLQAKRLDRRFKLSAGTTYKLFLVALFASSIVSAAVQLRRQRDLDAAGRGLSATEDSLGLYDKSSQLLVLMMVLVGLQILFTLGRSILLQLVSLLSVYLAYTLVRSERSLAESSSQQDSNVSFARDIVNLVGLGDTLNVNSSETVSVLVKFHAVLTIAGLLTVAVGSRSIRGLLSLVAVVGGIPLARAV